MAEKIMLYSTGCPQCKVLEKMLNDNSIDYSTCSEVSLMMSMGISSVPMLQVGEELMNFPAAMKWVKEVSHEN